MAGGDKRRPYSSDRLIFDFLFSGYLDTQRLMRRLTHFPENVPVNVIMARPRVSRGSMGSADSLGKLLFCEFPKLLNHRFERLFR